FVPRHRAGGGLRGALSRIRAGRGVRDLALLALRAFPWRRRADRVVVLGVGGRADLGSGGQIRAVAGVGSGGGDLIRRGRRARVAGLRVIARLGPLPREPGRLVPLSVRLLPGKIRHRPSPRLWSHYLAARTLPMPGRTRPRLPRIAGPP